MRNRKTLNSAKLNSLSQSIQLCFVNGKCTRVEAAQKLKVSQQTMGRYVKAPQTMPVSSFFTLLDHLKIQA